MQNANSEQDLSDQLLSLQAARGNPALLALATIDLAFARYSKESRTGIKEALLAASIPHWFDEEWLAALLTTTRDEAQRLCNELRVLTVVEPFPARGEFANNVHEATRRALRNYISSSSPAQWQTLSTRAHSHVANSREPYARIEAVYHQFAIDQTAAAAECATLDRELIEGGRADLRHALALIVNELVGESQARTVSSGSAPSDPTG